MIVHYLKNISVDDLESFINEEEGSTSTVNFLVYYNDELQESFEISYTNGDAVDVK